MGWDSAQQAGVYWTITTDPLSLVKTAGKHWSKARGWQTFSRGQIVNTVSCEPQDFFLEDSVLPCSAETDEDLM